jgi:hypothetical protein
LTGAHVVIEVIEMPIIGPDVARWMIDSVIIMHPRSKNRLPPPHRRARMGTAHDAALKMHCISRVCNEKKRISSKTAAIITNRGGRIIGILQQLAVDGTRGRVTGQNLVDQGPLVDFHPTHIGAAIGRGPYDIVIHIAVCSLLLLLLEFDSYQQPTQAVHGGRNGIARDG